MTRQSFYEGIKFARKGNRISDISNAIQTYVEAQGFSLVRDYVGHGVGANLHEDPEVPNFGRPGHGVRLQPGMTLAIEPMVNVGTYAVKCTAGRLDRQDGRRQAVCALREFHRNHRGRSGHSDLPYRRRKLVSAGILHANPMI